jgi:hypothetical protein
MLPMQSALAEQREGSCVLTERATGSNDGDRVMAVISVGAPLALKSLENFEKTRSGYQRSPFPQILDT